MGLDNSEWVKFLTPFVYFGDSCQLIMSYELLDKPDGAFQLISGDGSYGELRYFQDDMWHEVCYPYGNSDLLVEFDVTVAQHVCEELGFT